MNTYLQKTQRSFIIGDEWLYFKIYTGYKTSETIIREAISPLIDYLLREQLIDKWFFIRYSDPKHHLRIRFHLVDKSRIADIILNFNNIISRYVEDDLIWKVQADTYQREIERYGMNSIELSEDLFFIDSMATIDLISKFYGNESENTRWIVSMKMIDALLTDFGYNLDQKKDLLQVMQENFGKEFALNIESQRQLSTKYRKHKIDIETALNDSLNTDYEYIIAEKSKKWMPIIASILAINEDEKLEMTLSNLISSYIHMMLNRVFRTNQRKYEMVIYNFLFNYYRSQIARQKLEVNNK